MRPLLLILFIATNTFLQVCKAQDPVTYEASYLSIMQYNEKKADYSTQKEGEIKSYVSISSKEIKILCISCDPEETFTFILSAEQGEVKQTDNKGTIFSQKAYIASTLSPVTVMILTYNNLIDRISIVDRDNLLIWTKMKKIK